MRRTAILFLLSMLAGLSLHAQTAYSVQSDGDDKLYSIDLRTGVAKAIGPTGFGDIESLTFSPGCDTLYGIDDVTDVLVQCDTATGACEEVGRLGYDVTDTGLAVASNGRYYMSTDVPTPENLFMIEPATGSATKVGPQGYHVTGLAGRGKDLEAKCTSGLFGLEGDTPRGRQSQLLCLDPGTGAAHPIGPLKALAITDGGLDFTIDGTLYGIADGLQAANEPSRIFTVNPDTGEARIVATVKVNNRAAFGFEGLAIEEGICNGVVGERQSVLEIPALDGWGLAGLVLLLAAAGILAVRRRALRS